MLSPTIRRVDYEYSSFALTDTNLFAVLQLALKRTAFASTKTQNDSA